MTRVLRNPAGRYAFALMGTLLATYARIPLEPWLGDRIPFGPQLLVLLLTIWLVGTGPGLAALCTGIVATLVLVIEPVWSPLVANLADLFSLGVYTTVGIVAILSFDRIRAEHDLAELRAHENAKLAKRLREAARQKDEYLALLAHELRNPLAPIRTGLDLLDRSPDEAVAIDVREKLRRQVGQLARIVDDLLDVSRVVRGALRLDRETLDLREVVDVSLETVRPEFDSRGHHVIAERPEVPIYVHGDQVRLVQVVANLLTNAAKYTHDGGRVRVDLEVSDRIARLRVVDNGLGIPANRLTSIFRMFSRAHAPSAGSHGGLGLGLAIVQRLVELHEGRVWAESAGEGLGSRFVVELPTVPAPPEPLESRTDIVNANHESTRRAKLASQRLRESTDDITMVDISETIVLDAVRVLIVDDNVDAAQTLGALISLEGCLTRVCSDGPSALSCLDQFRPDVVLLDIGLPEMDGYEVARRIRAHYSPEDRPRLIAVTGWGGPEDRRRSQEAGFDHHFVKPVATGDLLIELRPRHAGGSAATRT